jgi:tetratricopeptide (TPR) repeat protein
MIIEQHYDDEVLIGLLDEADEDTHVPACDTCSGTLESYRDLSAALHDDSVWDARELPETPAPQTTNFLRAFAERTKAEDVAAAPIIAKLVADASAIDQHPEWRTAGVVRGLLKVVDEINFTDPKGAVSISKLASNIVDAVIATGSESYEVLRAKAWREYGWALYFVGSFQESLRALDRADEHIATRHLAECDRAEISLVRARVYRDVERFNEAVNLARESGLVFRAFGNCQRAAVAEAIEAGVLANMHRFEEAIEIESRIATDDSLDLESRASAINRSAFSLRELGRFGESKKRYAQAIAAFEELGLAEKRSMARWGLARVVMSEGQNLEAVCAMFRELRGEFADLGLCHDLALISLDEAEALLVLNRATEVVELCRQAIEYFRTEGLAYSTSAMTALAYLREAASDGTITPQAVRNVRSYIEVLPKQPHLLFASPL